MYGGVKSSPQSRSRTFPSPQPTIHLAVNPYSHTQPQATTDCPNDLAPLEISCKSNHTIQSILNLTI